MRILVRTGEMHSKAIRPVAAATNVRSAQRSALPSRPQSNKGCNVLKQPQLLTSPLPPRCSANGDAVNELHTATTSKLQQQSHAASTNTQ